MKLSKRLIFAFCMILPGGIVFSQAINVSIDLTKPYQLIQGFGGAVPDWLYGPNNSATIADMAVNDLGLSILRVYPTPTFEPANDNNDPFVADLNQFDLTDGALTNQIAVINKFVSAGLGKLILSVFSPPAWMKYNNSLEGADCLSSDPECTNRLNHDMYDEYAEFYSTYIKYLEQQTGSKVYAISPENEPRWGQWYSSCVYSYDEMKNIIKLLGQRFQDENIDVKIFAAEDLLSNFGGYESAMMQDPECKSFTDIIATHAYSDGINPTSISSAAARWKTASNFAQKNGKELWMTETSGYSTVWDAQDGPLVYGQLIHTALKYGNLSGWVWLTVNTSIGANEQEALIINGTPKKIYYVSKNFYRYIRPGAIRVDCTDDESKQVFISAYEHGEESRLTIVAINTSDETQTVSLQMENKPNEFTLYRTSSTENCIYAGTTDGSAVVLQPKSITTLVAEGTNHLPTINKVDDMVLLMNANGSKMINLEGISDGDLNSQNLVITATSSNPSVIPDPVIDYTSGQPTGTLNLLPVADQSGTTTITITLQDDGGQDNNGFFSKQQISFDVQIIPFINQEPTIDNIPDQQTKLNAGPQTITITGISDGNTGTQKVILRDFKTNTNVIKSTKITYTSGENTATYTYTPKSAGEVQVTITAYDDGDTVLNGKNEKSVSFNITVNDNTAVASTLLKGPSVYPNPADNYVNIQVPAVSEKIAMVEIFNMRGSKILTIQSPVSEGIIHVPLDELTTGMHFLKITTDKTTSVTKIMIKR